MNIQTALKSNPNNTSKAPQSTPTMTDTPKSIAKAVDISISGTPHRIVCPADEVQNLENAAKFINDKIREIRHNIKGKNPNNEELLVLTCLELYDQVQTLRDDKQHYVIEKERAKTLIDKMIKDARSVL
ncbi:cell division protein ZapA [Moraxella oblonga]|uniref:cell division protein ZapA n=1 Tax=Moraxella oblonga TaxID=200413 RepID=UPI00082AC01E|nr:cell division protein ZapA [Moraxella oblonga]